MITLFYFFWRLVCVFIYSWIPQGCCRPRWRKSKKVFLSFHPRRRRVRLISFFFLVFSFWERKWEWTPPSLTRINHVRVSKMSWSSSFCNYIEGVKWWGIRMLCVPKALRLLCWSRRRKRGDEEEEADRVSSTPSGSCKAFLHHLLSRVTSRNISSQKKEKKMGSITRTFSFKIPFW